MAATVSIEEYITSRFDKFFNECEWQNIELSRDLTELIEELESDVIKLSLSKMTTESEAFYEEAYNDGYEAASEESFELGKETGYERGYDDGYEEGYQTAELDLEENGA